MSVDYGNMTREQLLQLALQLKGEVASKENEAGEPFNQQPFAKRGKTVVIVDDSRLMQRRLQAIVEPLGFEVVGNAENGDLGVKQVLKHRPALVLLDYQMPVKDGEQTAKEIRQYDREVKILVVSGTLIKEVAQALLVAGVSDILVKPIDVTKFKESLVHIGFSLTDDE